jgi:hypothetical protein
MIPVSSYAEGEYKTFSTTVDDIVNKVNIDEKIKDFVTNDVLNTTLKSYVSNETLNDYPTTETVDDMIGTTSDVILENVDKKIKEAGHITRDEAIAIAENYVASYNTFKINGIENIKIGTTPLVIEGNNSGEIDWYTSCGKIDDNGNLTLKQLNWVDKDADLQTMTDVAVHATDTKNGKTTFSHNKYLSDKVWNLETATIKGEDLVVSLNSKWKMNTTGDMLAYNIGTTYNNEGVCGLSRENILCYSATAPTDYTYRDGSNICKANVTDVEEKFMASYACILLPVNWAYVDVYNPASTGVRLWATAQLANGWGFNERQSYNGNTVTINKTDVGYWGSSGGKKAPIHLLLRVESLISGEAMPQPLDLSGITITVR